jgi:hypothetical protein
MPSFDIPPLAGFGQGLHVVLKHRIERLLSVHSRCRGHGLHAVGHKGELDVYRLLPPRRVVVVEDGKRCSTGTKFEPPRVVARASKLMIHVFAGPSFHDGKASACASADVGRNGPFRAGCKAMVESRIRRSIPKDASVLITRVPFPGKARAEVGLAANSEVC